MDSGISKTPQIQTRFMKNARQCGVCFGNIEEQGEIDSCQHDFCYSCIKYWADKENTCPICKRRFHKLRKQWKRINYMQKRIKGSRRNKIEQTQQDDSDIYIPTRNQDTPEMALNDNLSNIFRIISQYYYQNNQPIDLLQQSQSPMSIENSGEDTEQLSADNSTSNSSSY